MGFQGIAELIWQVIIAREMTVSLQELLELLDFFPHEIS